MVTTKIGLALYLTLLAWSGALDVTRGESSELFKWIFFWMFSKLAPMLAVKPFLDKGMGFCETVFCVK